MSVHNEAKLGEIAKTVLMPGDPLRAKYIAENFLEDYKLVNQVRGIYAYTGKYKGKEVTVMASGMGMPSIGIYSYELYQFYGVENIIRIGSCGAYSEELNLLDVLLVENAYAESSFASSMTEEECHYINGSSYLNEVISATANETSQKIVKGNIHSSDVFYTADSNKTIERLPKEYHLLAVEMESFALFYIAKYLKKNAACLLTVSDSFCKPEELTSEQRQKSMNDMIKLALETSLRL